MQTETLLQSMIEETRKIINQAELLKNKTDEELQKRPTPNSWNALECLEHLNLYGDFYLPVIEKAIQNSSSKPSAEFKSGWLGNYFANSMLPKTKLNKMNTFKDKNPKNLNMNLDRKTIDRFLKQQQVILELLDKSRNVNIGKVKTAISISKLIKLKLGDTFRFIINHNIRHMNQIRKIYA